jgi:hypothetical protein
MVSDRYRCPTCRSLDAAIDLDKSVFEIKYIFCRVCGYHSYITWDDEDEWLIVAQDRAARAAIASPAPPGCARCGAADTAAAWEAIEETHVTTFVDEVHFGIDVKRCACGQHFAVVFAERVDYRDGDDSQTWLALPVSAEEIAQLRAAERSQVSQMLGQLGGRRRFLGRASSSKIAWWSDEGFAIPPHD